MVVKNPAGDASGRVFCIAENRFLSGEFDAFGFE